MANKINKPRSRSEITTPFTKGIKAQPYKLKLNINIGDNRKIIKLEELGIKVSFSISFTPSANAWSNPKIPTTLGPLLRCIAARTFLSNRVKKAIDKINGKIIGKNFRKSKSKETKTKIKDNLNINMILLIINIKLRLNFCSLIFSRT